MPGYEEQLCDIETRIKGCFHEAVDILHHQEVDKARQVMETYRSQVSDTCDRIVNEIVQGKVDGLSCADAAALALYVRFLKRISAHLKNILSSVVNPFHRIGYKEKKKGES